MAGPIENFTRDNPKVVEALKAQGWCMGLTAKNHIRFEGPAGQVAVTSGTPSEYRSTKNLLAQLKRKGFKPDFVPTRVIVPTEKSDTLEAAMANPVAHANDALVTKTEIPKLLDSDFPEVTAWIDAGELVPVPGATRSGTKNLYRRTDVLAFKESETYKTTHRVRRKYTKRGTAPSAPPLLRTVQLTVSANGAPTDPWKNSELVNGIVRALRPVIREEVDAAIREFYQGRLQ